MISPTSFFILDTDLAMKPSLPSSSPTRHFSATFSSSRIPFSVETKSAYFGIHKIISTELSLISATFKCQNLGQRAGVKLGVGSEEHGALQVVEGLSFPFWISLQNSYVNT